MTALDATPPWPLGFSTLGCPTDPSHAVASTARRHDIRHVELRVHRDGPVHPRMPPAARRAWTNALMAEQVAVVSLATYVMLAEPDLATGAVVDDAVRHVALAQELGAPAVRVFAGGPGDTATVARSRERLAAVLTATEDCDVAVLLETHDRLPRGADVAAVLEGLPTRAGAVWDVINPWQDGEHPAVTAEVLAGRIGLVQVKDAASKGNRDPVLPGTGAVPLASVLGALAEHDWRGVLSLEWERAWFPALPSLDTAIPAARSWIAAQWQTTRTRRQVPSCTR